MEVLRSLVRNGFVASSVAAKALGRPLRLRTGTALPPVEGVNLVPGPPFVWWELGLGIAAIVVGIVAIVVSRRRLHRGAPVDRLLLVAVVLLGAAVVVRSFRNA